MPETGFDRGSQPIPKLLEDLTTRVAHNSDHNSGQGAMPPEQRAKKQRYIRYVIALCLCLIPLFGYLQRGLLSGAFKAGTGETVLIFALINVNGLLLLLMLYLVLRNLAELVFERRQRLLGSRLRTRMVAAFVSLSLVPTALLFIIALRFVSASMDYWFNTNVEDALTASMKLAQSMYQETEQHSRSISLHIGSLLQDDKLGPHRPGAISDLFRKVLSFAPTGEPDGLTLLDGTGKELVSEISSRLATGLPEIPSQALSHVEAEKQPQILTRGLQEGELVQCISRIRLRSPAPANYFLVTSLLLTSEQIQRMQAVSEGITDYRQKVMLRNPIKLSLKIMLLIATLLILFGAIWFGFYMSRSLTGPINKLLEATQRVAGGELDFVLSKDSDDEMGQLLDSFNKMTADLRTSKTRLASANEALAASSKQAEEQGQYLATVLRNVAAGVISIAADNTITTINRFAEELLEIDAAAYVGHNYHKVLSEPHIQVLTSFIEELEQEGKPTMQRHLRFTVRHGQTYSLLVNVSKLADEEGRLLGHVIVFDNLTKLEKAQRLAAWQEVARRIAHEIKNPLTPIQLSAQRLRKRYLDQLKQDREIFDQCTSTIVGQVDEIKRLVGEFSDFARMPEIRKIPGDLAAMAEEILILYREAHRDIRFALSLAGDLPQLSFDPVQIKRVLINLLDNAVTALKGSGSVSVTISCNEGRKSVIMEVADDGPGIPAEIKMRLFEPYFSTRKSGTGLGLAISHTIVGEHNGSITVRDNLPHGALFVVELPLES